MWKKQNGPNNLGGPQISCSQKCLSVSCRWATMTSRHWTTGEIAENLGGQLVFWRNGQIWRILSVGDGGGRRRWHHRHLPQVFELIKVIRVIMVLIVKVVIVVALIDIFMIIVYVTLWYWKVMLISLVTLIRINTKLIVTHFQNPKKVLSIEKILHMVITLGILYFIAQYTSRCKS